MLDLQKTGIRDQGVKYIADALETNKVTTNVQFRFISVWSQQVLLCLHLDANGIGDKGAQCLAHALETNRVNFSDYIPIHLTLLFHRY